jgi:antitoxin component YwqK of YwqJK toxin-antitoxin module
VVKFDAVYQAGKLHGTVKKFAQDGEMIAKGEFRNGEPVNKEHVYMKKMIDTDSK